MYEHKKLSKTVSWRCTTLGRVQHKVVYEHDTRTDESDSMSYPLAVQIAPGSLVVSQYVQRLSVVCAHDRTGNR